MFKVIQEQTKGGCFNSTISKLEAVQFNTLTVSAKHDYLQENYFDRGHGEGAENLLAFADAIKVYGSHNVTSHTIILH